MGAVLLEGDTAVHPVPYGLYPAVAGVQVAELGSGQP
jgi:hypothetical protein